MRKFFRPEHLQGSVLNSAEDQQTYQQYHSCRFLMPPDYCHRLFHKNEIPPYQKKEPHRSRYSDMTHFEQRLSDPPDSIPLFCKHPNRSVSG